MLKLAKSMAKTNSFQKIILPNGLITLLYPMSSVMSVFASLYVRVGAVYEGGKERGISHFTEHASLLGTKSFPSKLSLNRHAQKMGATYDGRTDRFSTLYWTRLPYTSLSNGLNFLHELVFAPILDAELILKEKGVVASEFNDFWYNPEKKFWHEFWQSRFKVKEHPYSFRALGKPETIKKFDKEQVLSWREKFYHPNNMILSLAGNFETGKMLKTVARIFGKEKKGVPSEEPRFDPQGYSNFNLYRLSDSRPQITFSLSSPAFGRDEADRLERMRLGIINYVLGRGSGSRLFQRLRQKESFIYGIGSEIIIYRSLGALEISSSTAVEKLLPSLKAIKEEVEKLKAEGISQEEFSLANHFLDSATLLRFDNPESITYFFGDQELSREEIWSPQKYIKEAKKIKREEVNELAKEIFDFSRVNIGLLGNVPQRVLREIEALFKS